MRVKWGLQNTYTKAIPYMAASSTEFENITKESEKHCCEWTLEAIKIMMQKPEQQVWEHVPSLFKRRKEVSSKLESNAFWNRNSFKMGMNASGCNRQEEYWNGSFSNMVSKFHAVILLCYILLSRLPRTCARILRDFSTVRIYLKMAIQVTIFWKAIFIIRKIQAEF